jgi:hypothetical protein
MHSGAGDTTQLVPGYPIRTSWDHSSVDNSPRPIAASHVLHRLLVPRHPPCALNNLTTKMLASTVQFSTNNHPPRHPTTPTPTQAGKGRYAATRTDDPVRNNTLVPAGPNRVSTTATSRTTTPHPPDQTEPPTTGDPTRPVIPGRGGRCRRRLASVSAIEHPTPPCGGRGAPTRLRGKVLLRKEVIQPHLPVRLPCYDFVPIASPTFDRSLRQAG